MSHTASAARIPSEKRVVHTHNGEHPLISANSVKTPLMFPSILPQDLDDSQTPDPEIWGPISKDLETLLHYPHPVFWSQVLHGHQSLHRFLDTFLRFFPRPWEPEYAITKHPLVENCARRVLVVLLRIASRGEGDDDFFSSAAYADIVYNNWLLDMPKILDLCCIAGRGNYSVLRGRLIALFCVQPLYIGDALSSWESSMEILRKEVSNEEDILYCRDVLASWLALFRVMPELCLMLNSDDNRLIDTIRVISRNADACMLVSSTYTRDLVRLCASVIDVLINRCVGLPLIDAEHVLERDAKRLAKHLRVLSSEKAAHVLEDIIVALSDGDQNCVVSVLDLSHRVSHLFDKAKNHIDEARIEYLKVLLRFNGKPITEEDVDKILDIFPEHSKDQCERLLAEHGSAENVISVLLERRAPTESLVSAGDNVEMIFGRRRMAEDSHEVHAAKLFASQWEETIEEEEELDELPAPNYNDEYDDSMDVFDNDNLTMLEGADAESVVGEKNENNEEAVSQTPAQQPHWGSRSTASTTRGRGARSRRARSSQRRAGREKKAAGW